MNRFCLIPLGLVCIIILSFTPGVNASSISLGSIITGSVYTTSPTLITIDLSNQCLALVKHNQTSECPTYKKILPYDNSNQMLSGKFVTTDNFFHRQLTNTINHWGLYAPGTWIVMIDPDYNAIIHSKEISLVPSLTYIIKDQTVGSNHTRNEYHDRYVDPGCTSAEIVYSDFLLNDTIHYLESGCTITKYNETKIISTPNKTPIDYKNPFSSLRLQNQLKIIFNGKSQLYNENIPTGGGLGPGNCINTSHCTFTTSSKKPGY